MVQFGRPPQISVEPQVQQLEPQPGWSTNHIDWFSILSHRPAKLLMTHVFTFPPKLLPSKSQYKLNHQINIHPISQETKSANIMNNIIYKMQWYYCLSITEMNIHLPARIEVRIWCLYYTGDNICSLHIQGVYINCQK